MTTTYDTWIAGRSLASIGTNAGSTPLAFQHWRRFKEAFAPELVARAVRESVIDVGTCIDPFAGSGTTGLACQFLGVIPTLVEVNPYLADLSEAKMTEYDPDALARDLREIVRLAAGITDHHALTALPPTFVEPGVNGRWLFDRSVAEKLIELITAVSTLDTASHRRFFRVILGGTLVDLSNIVVSGKGRRYRRNWAARRRDPSTVIPTFSSAARSALRDIVAHGSRPQMSYSMIRGDARSVELGDDKYDLGVTSPPYANSFDYTDVYNVELWMLGYLSDAEGNRSLRMSALSSNVQLKRDYPAAPTSSPTLQSVLADLQGRSSSLWSPWIPGMIGGYFADLERILTRLAGRFSRQGALWMVVGDSRYADVHIPVATVLGEMASTCGWRPIGSEPFRVIRRSAQQGGDRDLNETLLVLQRRNLSED